MYVRMYIQWVVRLRSSHSTVLDDESVSECDQIAQFSITEVLPYSILRDARMYVHKLNNKYEDKTQSTYACTYICIHQNVSIKSG